MKLFSSFTFIKRLAIKTVAVVTAMSLAVSSLTPVVASATAADFVSTAKVSFTFDDGLASTMLAAETLKAVDPSYNGTAYITTGCVGVTEPINDCIPDWAYPYLTWDDISKLHNEYGWEIGSHGVTHASLRRADSPESTIQYELRESKAELQRRGFDATAFAFPYGHYDDYSLAEAAKHYASVRRFQDDGNNIYPYNDNTIMIRAIQRNNLELNGTPEQIDEADFQLVKSYIDEAVANDYWLVLVFHDITPDAATNWEEFEYTPQGLARIAEYVKSINLPVVTMTDGIATSSTNLIPNGSFNDEIVPYVGGDDGNGLAVKDVWSTDDPANIKRDTANNGSYPDPANSVSITAPTGSNNAHLYSPRIAANPAETYVVKSFINITAMAGGQIGFWVDEFDASGAKLPHDPAGYNTRLIILPANEFKVRAANFLYKPTSDAVASFRIQVVVYGGSGIHAYVDNFQVFPESALLGAIPTPEPTVPGDINGDGKVTLNDLSILSSNWNAENATRAQGDLNGDGKVNLNDLSILSSNWSNQ